MVLGHSVARSSSTTMQTSHVSIPVLTGQTSTGNEATVSVKNVLNLYIFQPDFS